MQYSDIKTTADYCAYVKDAAEAIVENAIEHLKHDDMPINAENLDECINDNGLTHDAVDGDALLIYYSCNDTILEHTDNEDYGAENIGWESMQADSWQGIKQNVAYWAFMGDVQDVLSEAITKAAYPEDISASQKELIAAEWERLDPLKRSYTKGAE